MPTRTRRQPLSVSSDGSPVRRLLFTGSTNAEFRSDTRNQSLAGSSSAHDDPFMEVVESSPLEVLQNIPEVFARSILDLLYSPNGLESLVEVCQTRIGNDPQPSEPVASLSSQRPVPSLPSTLSSQPTLLIQAQGNYAGPSSPARSEIPPSYSSLQSPAHPTSSVIGGYNLRLRQPIDVVSLHNRLSIHSVDVPQDDLPRTRNATILSQANTVQSGPDNLDTGGTAGPTLRTHTCAGRNKGGTGPQCGNHRPMREDWPWYCHLHISQAARLSTWEPNISERQCGGARSDGERCARTANAPPGLPPLLENEEMPPYFCRNHGFLAPSGEWVDYAEWIPVDVSPRTKVLLRQRMSEGPTDADRHGYIYCYELLYGDSGSIRLKVGRSENFVRRIEDWHAQCGIDIALKGWCPGPPEGAILSEVASRKTRVSVGLEEGGKNCHMLERLIHLHLKDLASRIEQEQCRCDRRHQEIFTFSADLVDPWEYVVKPVIEYWRRFVERYTLAHN